jgi:hypothetical protein
MGVEVSCTRRKNISRAKRARFFKKKMKTIFFFVQEPQREMDVSQRKSAWIEFLSAK